MTGYAFHPEARFDLDELVAQARFAFECSFSSLRTSG
jgi:hypothetical protein